MGKKGPVAEWLGESLQNPLQRFESARDLKYSGTICFKRTIIRMKHNSNKNVAFFLNLERFSFTYVNDKNLSVGQK